MGQMMKKLFLIIGNQRCLTKTESLVDLRLHYLSKGLVYLLEHRDFFIDFCFARGLFWQFLGRWNHMILSCLDVVNTRKPGLSASNLLHLSLITTIIFICMIQ